MMMTLHVPGHRAAESNEILRACGYRWMVPLNGEWKPNVDEYEAPRRATRVS